MSKSSRYFSVAKNASAPPVAVMDRHIACAGRNPELFFPQHEGSSPRAKAICDTCPAKEPCLEFALDTEQGWGIWGGTTPNERLDILRERGLKK